MTRDRRRDWRRGGRASPSAAAAAAAAAPHAQGAPAAPSDAPLRGECVRMCSEREQRERARTGELSRFERSADGAVVAVKKYRRAAAGGALDAREVRPPRVLLETLAHLFGSVLPCAAGSWEDADGKAAAQEAAAQEAASAFSALYAFLSDRVRAVRQDFTVQRVEDARLEAALEQIARFYCLAGLRAAQLPAADGWSDALHAEQLSSALAQLMELYRARHARRERAAALDDAALDREAAFVALDLLLRLEDARGVALALRRLPPRLRARAAVRRALGAFVALQLGDFRDFLARFEAMEALEQALALRQLPRVWAAALVMLDKALGRRDRVALVELGARLALGRGGGGGGGGEGDGVEDVERLCAAADVHVEHDEDGAAFARFKTSRPRTELADADARALVRAVALRRVRLAGRDIAALVLKG